MSEHSCQVEGCGTAVKCRGMCSRHYQRWRNHGDTSVNLMSGHRDVCSIDGCDRRRHYSNGLCQKHYMRLRRHGSTDDQHRSVRDRLMEHSTVDHQSGCREWGASLDVGGYGTLSINGRTTKAHRASYEEFVGPIPNGLFLDHLCRNRKCIEPTHLEPVTIRENTLRSPVAAPAVNAKKTHCKRGHEFTAENTYVMADGGRSCRKCRVIHTQNYNARKATAS